MMSGSPLATMTTETVPSTLEEEIKGKLYGRRKVEEEKEAARHMSYFQMQIKILADRDDKKVGGTRGL